LAKVRDGLIATGREVEDAELTYVPNDVIKVSDSETARKVMNLMNALEDIDEVVATHTNFDIDEGVQV